ncbi:MAG: hypothetical protein NC213_07810 [Acetobacter sp.]|nr:hypothetical protein [Bacteroides sp.]MCM1341635.1 hypothetical protein [Acetobacter sp.]MCM1434044.1 hypothetical protein [Clostridiales bacterium]
MEFGFSYVGLIYLLMLFIPNLFWTKYKPDDYEKYAKNENKILKVFESIGQVLVSCIVLIFKDFNIRLDSWWVLFLILSFIFMILYEIYWVRYFKSKKTMKDFYSSLLGIHVAGATLPVIAFLLLGIYGKNIPLITAVIILGIGHIGIHINHKKEIS